MMKSEFVNLTLEQFEQTAKKTLIAYWILIFISTHIPMWLLTGTVPRHSDKLAHFVAYAGLMFLIRTWQWLAERNRTALPKKTLYTVWLASLVVVTYSVFDELLQIPVQRTADPLDALADWVGGAIGLLLFAVVRPVMIRFVTGREKLANGPAEK